MAAVEVVAWPQRGGGSSASSADTSTALFRKLHSQWHCIVDVALNYATPALSLILQYRAALPATYLQAALAMACNSRSQSRGRRLAGVGEEERL